MTEAVNNLGRLAPEVGWIAGTIVQSGAGDTVALAYQSGFAESDQAQVALLRNSAGNYTLTVQNFLGLNGGIAGFACAMTTGLGYTPSFAYSYSGSTATITIYMFNSSATAADCSNAFEFKAI